MYTMGHGQISLKIIQPLEKEWIIPVAIDMEGWP